MTEAPRPVRIQLRRTKGWCMPADTVVVMRGPGKKWGNEEGARLACVAMFRIYAERLPVHELRGKNLACFCPPDALCHADVLLELANG